jgi:hypothetical protein
MPPRDTPTVDVELSLHRWYADSYAIELRFKRPNSNVDIPPVRAVKVQIDFDALREHSTDIEAYGRLLTNILFSESAIRDRFIQARTVAQQQGIPLRLRLFVAPSAPELSDLRWETLRDPQTDGWLITNQNVFFSRFLSTLDWREIRMRAWNDLRALAVVASPSDLHSYRPEGRPLTPIDRDKELARAVTALEGIRVTPIGPGVRASLDNICNHLGEEHDILYLVCHGALIEREPKLWLENEDGNAEVVDGGEIVARLSELQYRPSLVVLASCQSAGKGDDAATEDEGAMAALGPRLVMEAGIPAVLAMQGNVTMRTVSEFMPALFRNLKSDGRIDRAMTLARGETRDRPDSWMPVLFMRLTSGRIWYEPGFAGRDSQFERWPTLITSIKKGQCTPIIGSGFLEPIVGSTREIARRWSETHHYPMAPQRVEDLTEVAEFMAWSQTEAWARDQLRDEVSQEILHRFGDKLPDVPNDAMTEELITVAGAWLRQQNPNEPHNVLARLPFKIYLSTNPDSLIADALREAGKQPEVDLCRWNDDLEWPPSIEERNPDYQPDKDHPLVYHLFGGFQVEQSVVLTEDNYFDYLIGIARNNNPMPSAVGKALASSALLFLGFHLDDWDFRVTLRNVMSLEGGHKRKKPDYVHVAVQIDPEEARIRDVERARRYLESRFEGASINIYWGSVDDFLKELQDQWTRQAAAARRG